MTAPVVTSLEFGTIDELDAFMRSSGGGLDRVPPQGFRANLQNWSLPGFEVNNFQTTAHAGRWGPPERSAVNAATICLMSASRGRGITRPTRTEAYAFEVGDLEIAGHDAAQGFDLIGDAAGITRMTAVYLPAESLRALGAPVESDRLGLLPRSPLRRVVETYLQAFTPETQHVGADMLVHNFTELVSLFLRGTMTPGVRDAPGVLYSHYTRALQFMHRWYRDPDLNAAAVAAGLRISERTLFQCFSMQQRTFHQELLHIRLQHAAARLTARLPGEKVVTIAFDTGFDSLSTFNRTFKAKFGLSPTDRRPDRR